MYTWRVLREQKTETYAPGNGYPLREIMVATV